MYDARNATKLWAKTFWLGAAPPFTWALAFSGNSRRLAIGHWDAYAYVVEVDNQFLESATLKRRDRIYAIDIDASGGRLIVAGRDKTAAVYAVTNRLDRPYYLVYDARAKAFA